MKFKLRIHRAWLLFAQPVAFTLAVYGLWRWAWLNWGQLLPASDMQAAAGGTAVIALFHGLIATRAYYKIVDEREKIFTHLDEGEYVKFVRLRDKPIEWYTHWMLGAFSFLLIASVMLTHYDSIITGTMVVCGTTMIVAIFWRTAMAADNPLASGWLDDERRKLTPEERAMTLEQAAEEQFNRRFNPKLTQ